MTACPTVSTLVAGELPKIVVLATGGTIAVRAASDVQALHLGQEGASISPAAVPQAKLAALVKSRSRTSARKTSTMRRLKLVRRNHQLLAKRYVDGIVIMHARIDRGNS